MAFRTPITISKALGAIERREYVLPAIQREFVCSHPLPARFQRGVKHGVWPSGRHEKLQ